MDHFDPELPELTSDDERLKQFILDSARDDVPPAGARQQLLSTLKVAASGASGEGAAAARAPLVGNGYVLGLALLIGAASVSAVVATSGSEPRPSPAQAVATPTSAPTASAAREQAEPVVLPTVAADPPDAAPAPREEPALPSAHRSSVAIATSPPAPQASDDSLGRELARFTAARNALTGGDAVRTLQLLDAYDAEFPHGTFSVEVQVLRIEALARAGRVDEARQLGNRFLSLYPQGVFARRVAMTLAGIEPPSTPDR